MALNRSPEFQGVSVQIVYVVSAWDLTSTTLGTTCHAKFHASDTSGSEEADFNSFQCISMVQTEDT